jgi:hypothetical protein
MIINVQEFEVGIGVRFLISAVNPTEKALLTACADNNMLVETGDEVNEFYLRLPVSN